MNKNPFSLYDFLGYLFPGLITVIVVIYMPEIVSGSLDFKIIQDKFPSENYISWLNSAGIIVVFSYIIGHIIAYLSSVTVEYFTINVFGYPSVYLLNTERENSYWLLTRYFSRSELGRNTWKIIVLVLLLPLSLTFLVCKRNWSLINFVARPLEDYTRDNINDKLTELSERLGLSEFDESSMGDYHRIVMHYVYNNIPTCQRKADNYIAIYGFLRAVTLISCLLLHVLIWGPFILSYNTEYSYLYFSSGKLISIIILYIISVILYMAFVKFYRRFTLENYMTLLTEKYN